MTEEELREMDARNEVRAYLYDDGTYHDVKRLIAEVRRMNGISFCHTDCFCMNLGEIPEREDAQSLLGEGFPV